jgi:protein-disulfide isomerase
MNMKLLLLTACALLPCLAAGPELDKGKILGSPTAPIVIEVYSDYGCPACRNFHEQVLPTIVRDYVMTGKVQVISHEFPLNIPAHKFSREAANYATAAARLGIYQPVADVLFRTQESWETSGKVWDTVATVLSADQQKRIQALAKDPSVAAEVQRDLDLGNKERVNSTPAIFITRPQHLLLPYPINYNYLQSLLNGLK